MNNMNRWIGECRNCIWRSESRDGINVSLIKRAQAHVRWRTGNDQHAVVVTEYRLEFSGREVLVQSPDRDKPTGWVE